ncbi:hypothetical protein TYRP_009970 [Tyrophagus putrescentiae]|nr:hypothetical protein TYRP_009970 [Tyrophagus putrescentiae]
MFCKQYNTLPIAGPLVLGAVEGSPGDDAEDGVVLAGRARKCLRQSGDVIGVGVAGEVLVLANGPLR